LFIQFFKINERSNKIITPFFIIFYQIMIYKMKILISHNNKI